MPLISSSLDKVKLSSVYHPMQVNIKPHINLTAKTIEKLILNRFGLQLSPACIELMQTLMIEICDLYLFDAEKTKKGKANKSDDGPSVFTCLTLLVATILIFQKLVDKKGAINNLVATTPFPEDDFDIDELESEILNVENLNDESESAESSDDFAPQDNENAIFTAFSFALMTACKFYYDEEETHIEDVFDIFARTYKSITLKMDRILGAERLQHYPTWKQNASLYERAMRGYLSKFEPLDEADSNLLSKMGQGLIPRLKKIHEQLINQMKILTSFMSYNLQRKYVFSLVQVEVNALNELYDDLHFQFSMANMYQFLERAQEFVCDSNLFDPFQRYLREFGKLQKYPELLPSAPLIPSLEKIEHMFALFKISNQMPLRSISRGSLPFDADNSCTLNRRNSF
jgi:hypothetical protein